MGLAGVRETGPGVAHHTALRHSSSRILACGPVASVLEGQEGGNVQQSEQPGGPLRGMEFAAGRGHDGPSPENAPRSLANGLAIGLFR